MRIRIGADKLLRAAVTRGDCIAVCILPSLVDGQQLAAFETRVLYTTLTPVKELVGRRALGGTVFANQRGQGSRGNNM